MFEERSQESDRRYKATQRATTQTLVGLAVGFCANGCAIMLSVVLSTWTIEVVSTVLYVAFVVALLIRNERYHRAYMDYPLFEGE